MSASNKGFGPNSASSRSSRRSRLRETLLDVVETQIQTDTPPATRETLERLVAEGHPDDEARRLIASVLTAEMQAVLQEQQPYSEERYVAALRRLPQLPWDE
ncbi:MAG TPA: hypothetical protein V6D06_11500 [Trichocoleus sp.]